jgi:hypothetical protein
LEAGFRIDRRHQNRNRNAELAGTRVAAAAVIEPTVALIEDRAYIVDLPWGGRAASKDHERDEKQNAHHGKPRLFAKIDKM